MLAAGRLSASNSVSAAINGGMHESNPSKYERHLCSVILLFLTIMCIMSLPAIRDRSHDLFEFTHRFLGWSTLLLLWATLC
jgi:hypothetical protein